MNFGGSRGQSGSNNRSSSSTSGTILGWDVWEQNNHKNNDSSRMDWTTNSSTSGLNAAFNNSGVATMESSIIPTTRPDDGACHTPPPNQAQLQPLYGGDGAHAHPDPHLVCLKLGKRHYFEDHSEAVGEPMGVRRVEGFPLEIGGKKGYVGGGTAAVPRCQVEGCHVALVNAKDYHRRHKVCEMHSKAPKVIVLGLEQRFCQQCSRFHEVSEFDETKRSCKRRLAGHNERRRKSSHESSARNDSYHENKMMMMGGGFPYTMVSPTGRAHSFLSSKSKHSDLSSKSSAALRELIAENRAAILARQFVLETKDTWHSSHAHTGAEYFGPSTSTNYPEPQHLTLDLMQAPSPAFGILPGARAKTKDEDEDCCDHLWNTF